MTIDSTTAGALARAREALAERAALVRAVCDVCGGIVGFGMGISLGEPTREDHRTDKTRAERLLPSLHGWTRRHTACDDPVRVVAAVCGLRVAPEVAKSVLAEVHPIVVLPGTPTHPAAIYAAERATKFDLATAWRGRAWAHLTKRDREAFARVVSDERREHRLATEPHKCVQGPCGACGVTLSLGWHESPMQWSDGTPAPWCRDCYRVADRRPETRDPLHLRAIALEALSGASGMDMAERFGPHMQLFCELVDQGHEGTAERWEFAAERWAEVREAARMSYPGSLPPDLAADYRQRMRQVREEHDARRRESAREAARAEAAAAGWPID